MKRPSLCGTGLLFTLCIAILFFANLSRAGGWVAAWGDNGLGQSSPPPGLNNVKAIATGGFHNLVLRTDGTVVAWGYNGYGQTNVPAGLTGIRSIGCGYFHSLVVKSDGSVAAWGFNSDGQTNVPADLSAVTAVSAGYFHSLALKADGHVVAWGADATGQSSVPAGISNVTAIAASELNSAALTADGRVVAWGDNTYSQTNVPPNVTNVIAIAAGERHFVALKADGTVAAWGFNQHGETDLPPGLSNIVAIATGSFHTLALKADGTLISWGYGESSATIIPSVVTNVTAIAAGAVHNLVIVGNQLVSPVGKIEIISPPQSQSVLVGSNVTFSVGAASTEGPLNYQWLFNGSPLSDNARVTGSASATLSVTTLQLGDAGNYSVIVSNVFDSVTATAALTVLSPPFITSQPVDRSVRAGSDVTFSAAAGGTAPLRYQWNLNGVEIPGATSTTLALTNVQPGQSGLYHLRVTNLYGTALTVRASLTVTDSPPYFLRLPTNQVAGLGGSAAFSVSARGTDPLNYQWRFNGVDIPNATNASLQLSQLRYDQTGYYSVEVGNAFGSTNSPKALLNVSQVLVTGNSLGAVAPLSYGTNIPTGLSNVTAVAAGASFVMALKADGTVRTWLESAAGLFGSPLGVTNIPVSVTNVIAISAGYDHCLALRSNGTVIAWGGNSGSQINVPQGLTNVIAIAAGQNRSYAVKTDGTVAGWGSQQLPSGLSNIVSMVAGSSQNVALRRDGSVVTWPISSGTFTVVPALSNVIALATSYSGNMALRQDGTVWKWSSSGTIQPIFSGNFPQSNIVAIATGIDIDMLLGADGTLILPASFKRFSFGITNNLMAIAVGGVQSSFGVTVAGSGMPTFTLQPVSQIVQRSNTVQLHARAVGLQPMQYQWLLDNQPLPGATNASLMLSNFLGKDIGAYQMIASNILGAVASQIATVTIPFNTNLAAALNTTNLNWLTPIERTAAWFVQNRETHDGDTAAQSGVTTNGGQSTLQGTYVFGAGTLSFWWKVSSEEGFDFLRLYLDQSTTPLMSISGETGWERRTITFTNGTHTLRWAYTKDGSVSAGRDAGWLDEVAFTPVPPTAFIQPAILTTAAGSTASFFATTLSDAKPVTYQWMHSGTNLVGATNQTLSLPGVGRKDRGSYSVRVGNAGGNITTSNATLRVNIQQRLGAAQRTPDGGMEIFSRDADGGALSASDLPLFEGQASTNLVNWEVLPGVLSVTNGSLLLRDTTAAQWPQRFYRVVEH